MNVLRVCFSSSPAASAEDFLSVGFSGFSFLDTGKPSDLKLAAASAAAQSDGVCGGHISFTLNLYK